MGGHKAPSVNSMRACHQIVGCGLPTLGVDLLADLAKEGGPGQLVAAPDIVLCVVAGGVKWGEVGRGGAKWGEVGRGGVRWGEVG